MAKEAENKVEEIKEENITEVIPANTEVINVDDINVETVENDDVIILSKSYLFEGKTYSEIDLSGLDNLTAADMIDANKTLDRNGNASFLPEMSLEYACVVASKATKIPQEFFYALRPRDSIKLKNKVIGFFYGRD